MRDPLPGQYPHLAAPARDSQATHAASAVALSRAEPNAALEAAEDFRMQRLEAALGVGAMQKAAAGVGTTVGAGVGARAIPYDKYDLPPQAAPDVPMVVLTDLRIFHLYDIKDKEQTAHVDMLLELE